ncbi:T9SS type B sorting domain-containing protein [Myroides sp. LoEW2-1]|uniref:T9SS type B sorting domain-containing protein n=1 Tax=Myroides sp. LoEW2-1 TaxID=2683192 RepID=UPI0013263AE0|nr:T9SS type B sorting domain-containing protein [Myroides sp. LoEW2-1]MVX36927.1 T9SS type B sorting domain-containing protein [Myroides sp. LoEW2-1]
MSKRFWLLFFVLSVFITTESVQGRTNSIDYVSKESIATLADEQEQPNPEVKFGKPFNIEQCVPGLDANNKIVSNKMVIYLGEALKDKATGSEVDATGNAIVPRGYKYSFHETRDSAESGTGAIANDKLEIANPAAHDKTLYLRVFPVTGEGDAHVEEFILSIKDQGCNLEHRLVKLPDMYTCAVDGKGTFDLSNASNDLYYGQKEVELSVNGSKLVGPLNNYEAADKTVVTAQIKLFGTNDVASRTFTLFAESFALNPNDASLTANQSKEDKDGKRFGIFDLNSAKSQIIPENDEVDFYSISFHLTESDAKGGVNSIPKPEEFEAADGSVVYTRVESKLTRKNCVVSGKKVTLKVTEKPYIPALDNVSYCDNNVTSFRLSLTEQTIIIADGRTIVTEEEANEEGFDPTDKFTIDFFNSKEDAENNQNKIVGVELEVKINEARQIWTRITDLTTQSFNTASFYASIGYSKLKTEHSTDRTARYYQIDTGTTNSYTVDLRNNDSFYIGKLRTDQFGPSLNPEGAKLTVYYYKTEEDAKNDIRMDESLVRNYPIGMGEKSDLIYARVAMQKEFDCPLAENYSSFYASLGTTPVVEYYPEDATLQLCADSQTGTITPIVLGVTSKDLKGRPLSLVWMKKVYDSNNNASWKTLQVGEKLTYEAVEAGEYTVSVSFKNEPYPNTESCTVGRSWIIKDLIEVFVENADATGMVNSLDIDEFGNADVVIGSKGGLSGNYEYAIDRGGFQMNNRFMNVPIGNHTAWVRDVASGCMAFVDFSVFGYPKYFTPNGDGYNDVWNIPGLKGHPEARIAIFDRYGKLLKQMSAQGEGWDGTFNGKPMPSTDYWFTVEFTNDTPGKDGDGQKVSYKGHFSLKR